MPVQLPIVNILAIDFQFGAAKEERMALSFLTCFPRIQILHIKNGGSLFKTSVDSDGTLWKKKIDPIKCVKSTIEKLVLHGFCGGDSELSFFKSILKSANMLKEICILFSRMMYVLPAWKLIQKKYGKGLPLRLN
ncbi:hypothetical protein VPH35_034211 [Triticum aestivum]|uniref:Uncharacterized protein n=1 Tax=Aegilops tauschii TaxID=37682 RepID=M8BLD9_AEGTA